MNRILPILALLLLAACAPQTPPETPAAIQNILFIIGDDHSAEVLGAYGNPLVRTPNLDRLAGQGIRFTRAYANSPLCSASRQSFLTGRYPHATGVTLLTTSFPEENLTVAEHLKAYGYHTAAIGKMHFNNKEKHGFDTLVERNTYREWLAEHPARPVPDSIAVRPQWKPFRDPANIWLNADAYPGGYYDEDDIGTFYARTAIDFLEKHKDDKFSLWVIFPEPHPPFIFPAKSSAKTTPAALPLPPGSPEDDRWIPAIFKDLTEEERRGIVSAYYSSVEYLDKNVGLILDRLDALGLRENTLVVYIGDHGYLLNDHKRFEKHMMWEPAVRAPLLIRAGSRYGEGRVAEAMTEFVDLAPTFMDVLGIPQMPGVQGKSLLPLLTGETPLHKEHIFSEFLADNKAMVRTHSWKYIFTTGQHDLQQGYATGNPPPGIPHRLYDLENDPDETTDVSAKPENAQVMAELQAALIEWFRDTHPGAAAVPETLSVEAQLIAFCEPPDAGANLEAK